MGCCNALPTTISIGIGISFRLNFYRCQCFIVLISVSFLLSTKICCSKWNLSLFVRFALNRTKTFSIIYWKMTFQRRLSTAMTPRALMVLLSVSFGWFSFASFRFFKCTNQSSQREEKKIEQRNCFTLKKKMSATRRKKPAENLLASVLLSPNRFQFFHFLLSLFFFSHGSTISPLAFACSWNG